MSCLLDEFPRRKVGNPAPASFLDTHNGEEFEFAARPHIGQHARGGASQELPDALGGAIRRRPFDAKKTTGL